MEKPKHTKFAYKTEREIGNIRMTVKEISEDEFIIDLQYSTNKGIIKELLRSATKIVKFIFKNGR